MQEIYTDDIGSGFPLILVHGYLGSSEMWKFQKDYLSKNFRIISPLPIPPATNTGTSCISGNMS